MNASNGHHDSAELVRLFTSYTGSPTGIGPHLAEVVERATGGHPLIVGTGTDLALYPGGGRPPRVQAFRVSTRGFTELAAVSHLGPALASLARMRQLDPGGVWRRDGEALLTATRAARAGNSVELWRDRIAVAAYAGREPAIAAMVDHACAMTEAVLQRALGDEAYLTAANLRADYLEGPGEHLPVPFNRIMIATFFLTGLDLAHRLLTWFDGLDLPWERTMVIIAGRQGRPTAGVDRESNSVAGVVAGASRGRLPDAHLLIAPHAPVFPAYDGSNLAAVAALERSYRLLWSSVTATSQLGQDMFAGHPRFAPRPRDRRALTPGTRTVSEKPAVRGPDDWAALTTRLGMVLEDPRQLLSGAVTDIACAQLVAHDNQPGAVVVPGLDGEPYPPPRAAHDRLEQGVRR